MNQTQLLESPHRVLAVDPGLSGAAALLGAGQLIVRRDFKDLVQLARAVAELAKSATHAVMENVHAMPGQGVCSMFSFGRAAGAADGALAVALPEGVEVEYVTPQVWQKTFHPVAGEFIKSAATRDAYGQIHTGKTHWLIPKSGEQGFTTSLGRFVSREDAFIIAASQNQIGEVVGTAGPILGAEHLLPFKVEFDAHAAARSLFTDYLEIFERKKDHNTADAVLMAAWKTRGLYGQQPRR